MADSPLKPAHVLARLIRSGQMSPVVLMEETLKRIETLNPDLNAFVCLRGEQALNEAGLMARHIAAGHDPGPLAGIPIGVKDTEDVKGFVTSFGSVPYKDNMAQEDSVQVARLKAAGAIIVGKTNTPEFAFTGFTKNRLFGVTRNPWDRERTPGGSSGGSAAAVASGMVPLATGSDAGGSIRIPACYSGCFGLKPSQGRIPLAPMHLLYMSGLWTFGPLSRNVPDAALFMDCVCGRHPSDPGSLPPPGSSYVEHLDRLPPGLKIGFSPTLGYAVVQDGIMRLAERAARVFKDMGHSVEMWEEALPQVGQAWADLTACDIYAQVHGDLDRIRSTMGRTLVAALDHAKGLSADDFIAIRMIRDKLNEVLAKFFSRYDLLLTPAMPTEAFAAEGPPPGEINGRPVPLLLAVAFTYPFNLSGHPAATVRSGLTTAGLPAGLQIIAPRHRDDLVLQAAHAYERAHPWDDEWPRIY